MPSKLAAILLPQRSRIMMAVDDFLTKPLDSEAIRMRLRVAERILKYTARIRQLQELIPICRYCRKKRPTITQPNEW